MSVQRTSGDAIDRRVRLLGQPVDEFPELAPGSEHGRILRITEAGETILSRRCQDVTEVGTPELEQLIADMFATMYAAQGVGLAANQVDVDLRLFVYDCPDDYGIRHVGHILNPDIELPADGSRRLVEAVEGCLSVPGAGHSVARPDWAVAHGIDLHGNPIRIAGTGYFARCLLHETDHVDGTLYIDRLSKRNRRAVMQEMSVNRDQVLAERAARATAMGKEPAEARPWPAVSSKDPSVS
ncbi:peptide deformylase [Micromonospora sp. WMMD1155]|uniref:peptide deformylase n=1 Tax=Micromonospora sp. WMMD1155 TaxID=3016094 RepID=UPI00249B4BD1|nr:peptide deformylase [Micromonospora sp. WMMD1155]WFE54837.1 peptide deformylase [Micromonospora sp. WMMD1155]